MFHPTLHVPDLKETVDWFERVFCRPSTVGGKSARSSYASGYNRHTDIAEVMVVSVDTKQHLINGQQPYPAVESPRLAGIGWYAENAEELYFAIRAKGIGTEAQFGQVDTGESAPVGSFGDYVMYFTKAVDTGLRYEFISYDEDKAVTKAVTSDIRLADGWQPGQNEWDPKPDPLGISICSHHTVLTRDTPRALRLYVDVMGGEVIGTDHNVLLDCDSTYVSIADSVLEFATPRGEESPAVTQWRGDPSLDTYYGITWLVDDVDAAAKHLAGVGVGLQSRSDTLIVVDPADGLGVPWGFTAMPPPGDTR